MYNIYKDKVRYERVRMENDSNTHTLDQPVIIDALRLKGNYSVTTSESGDSVTCSVVIRTKEKIPKYSRLDGHEVVDSVRVDSILKNAGYINYLK